MDERLRDVITEAIQTKLKKHDYLSEKFNTDEKFMEIIYDRPPTKIYKALKRSDGAKRAVKSVSLKFDISLKKDSTSSLTKKDGLSVMKFVQALQESVIVETHFSENPCIVSTHESWLQQTAAQTNEITEEDILILINLVNKLKKDNQVTVMKLKERKSLLKLEGYSIYIELDLYDENLEMHLNSPSTDEERDDTTIVAAPELWLFHTRNIAIALEDIHSKGFVHFDVKPHNVFLDSGGACLGDFGSAKKIDKTSQTKHGSTKYYNGDPNGQYSIPSFDIWSLGCLILRMFSKNMDEFQKFFDERHYPVKHRIDFDTQLRTWKENGRLDENAFHLINECLDCDVSKRWTAEKIVKHIDSLTESVDQDFPVAVSWNAEDDSS